MVILDIWGKIEPVCISKKLKIFVANPPCEVHNNWQSELVEELIQSKKIRQIKGEKNNPIAELYHEVISDKHESLTDQEMAEKLVSSMIYLYFDYEYKDMPLGDWETNCFDGRLCEGDYAEKIVDFIRFLAGGDQDEVVKYPQYVPQWTYSSNYDQTDVYRIFWGVLDQNRNTNQAIEALKEWGKLLDNFLIQQSDYYLLDYLCTAFNKEREYNTYDFGELYSLCQLFLEKEKTFELDGKLPDFLDNDLSRKDKFNQAKLMRLLRNKIDHGDYEKFNEIIKEYAESILDGRLNYDYSEFSRKNWVLQDACYELERALSKVLYLFMTNREELKKIKSITYAKPPEYQE